jgi:hypothetical protein
MKYVVCINDNSKSLTDGKVYVAMESMYPNISEYFVSDDSLKQHWYSKSFFREATEEEIVKYFN